MRGHDLINTARMLQDALLETAALSANLVGVQLLLREADKKEVLIAPETLQEVC